MNEKDRVIAAVKKPPTLTDRLKSVFGFSRKQLVGGHEQDNHDEVSNSDVIDGDTDTLKNTKQLHHGHS